MMIFKNHLILVYIISFVDLFAIGLTFPLLAPHLRDLGASHTLIGVLSSMYAGIQVVSGPIIGGWTDVKGRKQILQKILLISGICYGLLGLTESFSIIVIIRVVLGLVKHIQTICKAVITDTLPPSKHTEAFGRSAAISSLGFILGPFIGGQISEIPGGFRYVSVLTMTLFFINIGVASYLPEGKETSHNNKENSVLMNIKVEITKTFENLRSIDWSHHWDGFTLRFLLSLAMTTFFTNQDLLLKERYRLSQKYSGYVISYFSTIGTCSAFFFGQINIYLKQNDCFTRLLNFFVLMFICIIVIYISPNIFVYLFILIPLSISSTALRIISMELILQKSHGDHRGSLSGASSSVMSISRFVAPLITGPVADMIGDEAAVLVAVVPAFTGTLLCAGLKARQNIMSQPEDVDILKKNN